MKFDGKGKFGVTLNPSDMTANRKRLTDKELRESALKALDRRGKDGLTDYLESMAWGRVAERVAFMGLLTKIITTNSSTDVTHKISTESLSWLRNRSIGKTDTQSVAHDPENTIDQDVTRIDDAQDVESRPIEDDPEASRRDDGETA